MPRTRGSAAKRRQQLEKQERHANMMPESESREVERRQSLGEQGDICQASAFNDREQQQAEVVGGGDHIEEREINGVQEFHNASSLGVQSVSGQWVTLDDREGQMRGSVGEERPEAESVKVRERVFQDAVCNTDVQIVREIVERKSNEIAERDDGNEQGKEDDEKKEKEKEDEEQGNGEEEEEEDEEEEEEEEEEERSPLESDGGEEQLVLTDYEKQREQRVKENAAKLASLNLSSLASVLRPVQKPQRQARNKKRKKDDDYMPSNDSISSDSESFQSDENVKSSKEKQKNRRTEMDEEQALQQAIALSLGTPVAGDEADANGKVSKSSRRKAEPHEKKDRRKRKKDSQEQFTMDEIASIFAVIDERGNGKFSKIELEGIVRSFDFSWSKQEIADMIDIFDDNKDGQLDICEFQNMFGRLNMSKMHEM